MDRTYLHWPFFTDAHRALQHGIGCILRGDQVFVRMKLVGPDDSLRPAHADGMVIPRSALGSRDVIPAVFAENVRALDQPEFGAAKDVVNRTDELLRLRIPFLAENAVEGRM